MVQHYRGYPQEVVMIWKMYSVRDAKAEVFKPPFYKQTHGEAERDFRMLCNDEKSIVAKYPEDFDLWYMGEFDDCSGKMQSLSSPQHIIKAIQCVAKSVPLSGLVKDSADVEMDVVRQ
jgi:hypothetical protein